MKERRPSSLELDEIELSETEILWIKDAQRYFRADPNFKQRKRSFEGKCYRASLPPPLPQLRVSEEFTYAQLVVNFAGPVYVKS